MENVHVENFGLFRHLGSNFTERYLSVDPSTDETVSFEDLDHGRCSGRGLRTVHGEAFPSTYNSDDSVNESSDDESDDLSAHTVTDSEVDDDIDGSGDDDLSSEESFLDEDGDETQYVEADALSHASESR